MSFEEPVPPNNISGPIANATTLQLATCCPNFSILEIIYSDVEYRNLIKNENIKYKDS